MTAVWTNVSALNSRQALLGAQKAREESTVRLSTGQRINSVADDAAGTAVSVKLQKNISGSEVALANAMNTIEAIAIIDTAYESINFKLSRMNELAIQSASETYSSAERQNMDDERTQLLYQINSLADSVAYNNRKLLDGTFKDVIGQIGPTEGEFLDIDFEKVEAVRLGKYWEIGFDNNDFSETAPVVDNGGGDISIPGWDIGLKQVALAPDASGGAAGVLRTIGGHATPADPTPTPQHPSNPLRVSRGDDYTPTVDGTYNYEFADGSMRLYSSGLTVNGGDVTHGPYIVSKNAVTLSTGDKVAFNWSAKNGGDYYDVFAYLLNVNDGSTITILDETGNVSDWQKTEVTVNTPGDYKFVFVSGTFDATFGTVSGASLYIDDIDVTASTGPEVVIQYINFLDVESSDTALGIIELAQSQVATHRAYCGALTNRLLSAVNLMSAASLKQQTALSRINDAEYAVEVAKLTKASILEDSAAKILQTSLYQNNIVLDLLKRMPSIP